MSVQVTNLSKYYGQQKAVDDLSFEVKRGEILGFLGPNGAGKSTTMKMLTGFLPPFAGQVSICGFDISAQALAARNCVGYLPENNPLYPEMYIREYLEYVASIYQVKHKGQAVEKALELTGLVPERHKKIGQLSKGYRQRVGLAQAIIHDPQVLILDEPTTGLDPNQLTEIRQLIRMLGAEKIVILSTHIMQEVEAVCDRVLILNHGKVVADSPVNALLHVAGNTDIYRAEFDKPVPIEQLRLLIGMLQVEAISDRIFRLTATPASSVREQVFALAVKNENMLLGLQQETMNLEAIFKNLTQN